MRRGSIGTGATVILLIAGGVAAGDDPRTPQARLAAIEAGQKVASARYAEGLRQAGDAADAQQAAVDRFLSELRVNVEAALDLARDNRDDPAAAEALRFVIRTNRAGPGDATARALRMILDRDDVRLPGQGAYLPHVALPLFQYPDAEKLLRRTLDENPGREDRAGAGYWLAQHLRQQARMARLFREKPGATADYEKYTAAEPIADFVRDRDPEALEAAAEGLLERVAAEFGEVRLEGNTQALGPIVAGELFAIRNLAVGKVAPEIDGTDAEGRPLRLGDHRGKVVVLTFSGNWCGPCVAMYPQERALAAAHKDRPFALLSVNTDEDVATLRKAIADAEITWPCWWDGGQGPIVTRWGINRFPSIFVLDRRGVIRFKDLRGDALDQAVARLLDEDAAARDDAPPR